MTLAEGADLEADFDEEVFWPFFEEASAGAVGLESVLWPDGGVDGDCANEGATKIAKSTK